MFVVPESSGLEAQFCATLLQKTFSDSFQFALINRIKMAEPLVVTVSGAAGQIGYSLLPLLASE